MMCYVDKKRSPRPGPLAWNILQATFLLVALAFASGCASTGGWRIVDSEVRVYYARTVSAQGSGARIQSQLGAISKGDAESLGMALLISGSSFLGAPLNHLTFVPDGSKNTVTLSPFFIARPIDEETYQQEVGFWHTTLGIRDPKDGVPQSELPFPVK